MIVSPINNVLTLIPWPCSMLFSYHDDDGCGAVRCGAKNDEIRSSGVVVYPIIMMAYPRGNVAGSLHSYRFPQTISFVL